MRFVRTLALVLVTLLAGIAGPTRAAADKEDAMPTFYDLETTDLEGKPVDLSEFAGKVALVVNVASQCGLTPQYRGLERLYEKYGDKGLVVMGFPSNDFLGQEPGSPEDIRLFCTKTYGVTFPMFSKRPVKGDAKGPVYSFLTEGFEDPSWNFTKYLVSRDGRVLQRFEPTTKPNDPELRKALEEALGD